MQVKKQQLELDMETQTGSQLQKEYVKAAAAAKSPQSCPALCDPTDGSPPGSLIPGILQARILEWIAISYSRGSFRPGDQTDVSCIGRWILYTAPHG